MLILATILTVLLMVWRAVSRGPESAIQYGWAVAVIAPTWVSQELGPLKIDMRLVVVAIACLIGVIAPFKMLRLGRWLWLDLALVTVLILTNISQWHAGIWGPVYMIESVQFWLLPYLLGRIVAASSLSNQDFVRVGAIVGIFIAAYCLGESVSHSNVLNDLVGRFGSPQGESDYRFGLKRAEATFQHPISCGMVVAMLSPFVFTQANRALRNEAQKIWIWGPLISFLGVLGTLSRGPISVWILMMIVAVAFTFSTTRIPILCLGILGIFAAILLRNAALTAIERVEVREDQLVIEILGESYEYTGTRHRFLQFLVYSNAISDSGWLGYGAWGALPSHELYLEADNRWLFRSIDNHFILQLLNTGWLGLAAFLLLIITTVYYGLRLAIAERNANRLLAMSLAGVSLAVAMSLNTVWFAYDFGYLWLCNSGIVSSLWARHGLLRAATLNSSIALQRPARCPYAVQNSFVRPSTAHVPCSES